MAKQKQELAAIDFTQFSVTQLPELKGKKEEIALVIKANPIVEIVDTATYESAKKSRTSVKTLRTSLEKEKKEVNDRIKKNVLEVVSNEYDSLITEVKKSEFERQVKVDDWEEKKEQEKQEKARLEQERIDEIKTKISDYVASWKDAFNLMDFAKIKEVSDNFKESNATFDRIALQEFDVLFDREISMLSDLLDSKIKTLNEQEQIRIDNLLIQEKNTEQSLIQEWQRTWNANIDTLSVSDVADVKSVLAKSKLANLKHYVSGYEEIYLSTEKRLHSQIEFVSKAEEQRIAQEKLYQDKKEFEEKQVEVKFQERKKFLVDEDYWRIYLVGECAEEEDVAKGKLLSYNDAEFEKFKVAVLKAKNPIEELEVVAEEIIELPAIDETKSKREFDSEPIVSESITITDNRIVRGDYEEPNKSMETQKVDFEETWDNLYEKYKLSLLCEKAKDGEELLANYITWLEENYNAPTKKQ